MNSEHNIKLSVIDAKCGRSLPLLKEDKEHITHKPVTSCTTSMERNYNYPSEGGASIDNQQKIANESTLNSNNYSEAGPSNNSSRSEKKTQRDYLKIPCTTCSKMVEKEPTEFEFYNIQDQTHKYIERSQNSYTLSSNFYPVGQFGPTVNIANDEWMLINIGYESDLRKRECEANLRSYALELNTENTPTIMCTKCANNAINILDNQIDHLEKEACIKNELVIQMQHNLEKEIYNSNHQVPIMKEYTAKLLELDKIKQDLVTELKGVQEQEAIIDNEISVAIEMKDKLDHKKEVFRRQIIQQQDLCLTIDDEIYSTQTISAYLKDRIKNLQNKHLLTATFHIVCTGEIGTINSFDLGQRGSMPINWNQCNAAWGQITLLFNAFCRILGITFSKYIIYSNEQKSYIIRKLDNVPEQKACNRKWSTSIPTTECTNFISSTRTVNEPHLSKSAPEHINNTQTQYPLYTETFENNYDYDKGITAFAACMLGLEMAMIKKYNRFHYPRHMSSTQIEYGNAKYSLRTKFNTVENWTTAMKALLTNLKHVQNAIEQHDRISKLSD